MIASVILQPAIPTNHSVAYFLTTQKNYEFSELFVFVCKMRMLGESIVM